MDMPSTLAGIAMPGQVEQRGHDVLPADQTIVDAVEADPLIAAPCPSSSMGTLAESS